MTNAATRIRITSYLSAPEADLAQMLLRAEGIPVWLENAGFLSWYWHYLIATQGVRVYVSPVDVERARAVLWPARQTEEAIAPRWQCKKCEADIDSTWVTCWHCGTSTEGEEAPDFFEQPAIDQSIWHVSHGAIAAAVGMSGPLLFVISHGSFGVLAAWAMVVAFVLMMQSLWRADEEGSGREVDASIAAAIEADPTEPSISNEYARFEDTICRTWQSAGVSLWFYPLVFYAIWLLMRLKWPAERWKPRERRRYYGAWAFSIVWILLFFSPFLLVR